MEGTSPLHVRRPQAICMRWAAGRAANGHRKAEASCSRIFPRCSTNVLNPFTDDCTAHSPGQASLNTIHYAAGAARGAGCALVPRNGLAAAPGSHGPQAMLSRGAVVSAHSLATVLYRVPFLNEDACKSLFFKMRIKTKYPIDPKATHHLKTHTIYQTESPTRGSKYCSYSSTMRHFVYPFDVK